VRTFIAVWLPVEIRDTVAAFVRDIRSRGTIRTPVRWVRPETMHLTVQFLGDISGPMVSRVEKELGRVEFRAFRIHVRGVGFFPRESQPRVFWAGVTSDGFLGLADRIHGQMEALGFQPPAHPLKPHLTLARAQGHFRLDNTLVEIARGFRNHEFGSTMLDHMALVESRLSPDGARYSEIAGYKCQDRE